LGIFSAVLFAPRYTLWDVRDWMGGVTTSQSHFFGETMSGPIVSVNLPRFSTDFAIPMFVFQGADDNITPAQMARAYVDSMTAPQKQFVLITGAGHMAMSTKRDEFLKQLVERVRPLAIQPEPTPRSAQSLKMLQQTTILHFRSPAML
jgi:proline iminopeptidase